MVHTFSLTRNAHFDASGSGAGMPSAPPAPGVPPVAPARKRVLVIEDDGALRALLAEVLAMEGIEATTAADAAQALALCASGGPYSVVLLDWHLGGATGSDFAAALQALPAPHPPIVLVTADGNELDHVEQIGAHGFLKKPFSLEELIETVQRFGPRAERAERAGAAAEQGEGEVVTPAAPLPTAATTKKGEGERERRERRLRWMAGEVGRIQDETRSHGVALEALTVAARRGPLLAEERARRRDLSLAMTALRLRLAELYAEFEAVRSGDNR